MICRRSLSETFIHYMVLSSFTWIFHFSLVCRKHSDILSWRLCALSILICTSNSAVREFTLYTLLWRKTSCTRIHPVFYAGLTLDLCPAAYPVSCELNLTKAFSSESFQMDIGSQMTRAANGREHPLYDALWVVQSMLRSRYFLALSDWTLTLLHWIHFQQPYSRFMQ